MRRPRLGSSRRTSVDSPSLTLARAEEFAHRLGHHETPAAAQSGHRLAIKIAHVAHNLAP